MVKLEDIQLIEKLGSGGFGEVHEARASSWRGSVAVKFLKVQDEAAKKRLVREVKLLSTLNHKNIVPILDFQLESDPVWFAMPLADESLFDRMSLEKIPLTTVHEIFLEILDGMQYAHEHESRIVHRDLKPENILILGDNLFVSDFGLGKPLQRGGLYSTLTQNTVGLGSRGYSPPEQMIDVRDAQEQADIYSLGMVLYAMLTNSNPDPVFIAKVPKRYKYTIQRCKRDEPSDRFASIRELRTAFLQAIDDTSFTLSSPVEDRLTHIFSLDCTSELANEVVQLLYDNVDNRSLYQTYIPQMGRDYIEYFVSSSSSEDFKYLINQFDIHVSGRLNFKYCDEVASFYQWVCELSDDLDIYKLLLERLLIMGVMHNRWYVMEVFCNVLCQLTKHDPGKTMTAIEVIEKHPDDFKILHLNKFALLCNCSLPRLLRATIEATIAESGPQ